MIHAKQEEQHYFADVMFPEGTEVHKIICEEHQQGEEVLSVLNTLASVDAVWGALESSAAKVVRHFLQNERKVSGKNNHTKAYWNLKSKKTNN